jgi:hypothetical protein
MKIFQVIWNEDGSATCLTRVTARNGSGAAIPSEGKWLQQADVASITCKVIDVTNNDTEITPAPTVSVASVILNTPVTDGTIWDADTTGYNFLHDLAGSYFPTGGNVYQVEYYFTLTGGVTTFGVGFRGVARGRKGG